MQYTYRPHLQGVPKTRYPWQTTRWATGSPMRHGEIRLIDLEPVRTGETDKRRPAIIVSYDSASAAAESLGRGAVTVVPITSNVTRMFPFQALT